jgi:DNA-directed RNA polymerase gamma chain (EC 2.7.7.6)
VVVEIPKRETIYCRTFHPEMNGLFIEKIFDPCKDWEIPCSKHKRVPHRGMVCERCGVEVKATGVHSHRMGFIKLTEPVWQVWYLKGIPRYGSIVLGMPLPDVDLIVPPPLICGS